MLLKGEYLDINGSKISVEITTGGMSTPVVKVNDGQSGVYFAAREAVTIQGQTNDVFDPCLRQSAQVKILTPEFISGLFMPDVTGSDVVIERDGATVFRGRVLPQTYSQPFVETLDSLDINLIDHLSALEYMPWRSVMGESRKPLTLGYLLTKILEIACEDMEVKLPQEDLYRIGGKSGDTITKALVNPVIFMDDDDPESDRTLLEVLEGLLRYLGLHVTQEGDSFVVFRKECQARLTNGAVTISNAEGTDTQIEVGEIFNKISVEVDCDEREELLESPMDPDGLTSAYTGSTPYCTDYCKKIGTTEWKQYRNLIAGKPWPETHGDGLWTRDWHIRVMDHEGWRFYYRQPEVWDGSPEGHGTDYKTFATSGEATVKTGQECVADLLQSRQGSALLRIGTARTDYKLDDWNPPAVLTWDDCLVIGVGGDLMEEEYEDAGAESNASAQFRQRQRLAMPRAIYRGSKEGVALSPEDVGTNRYIVITGEVALAPVVTLPYKFSDVKSASATMTNSDDIWGYIAKTGLGDSNRARGICTNYATGVKEGLTMFEESESGELVKMKQRYQLDYVPSPFMGYAKMDPASKIGVLACMLIVGDKCLVEKDESGNMTSLVWETYRTPAQCGTIEEYIKQSFTIGIDPKYEDPLVGKWYDIANNVRISMGISEEGMAIPVRNSDEVSGEVTFIILGPTDLMQMADSVKEAFLGCRYGYLNPGSYEWKGLHVMRLVSSIWLKNFEIKIVSDNGGVDPVSDGRLVYVSATNEAFRHERTPEVFLFGSALTSDERKRLGLRDMVRDNTVMAPDGSGVTVVYDPVSGELGKPEQLYVDRYYRECSRSAIELWQSVREDKMEATMRRGYTHPALPGKVFLPLAIDRDLSEGTARMRLRERR